MSVDNKDTMDHGQDETREENRLLDKLLYMFKRDKQESEDEEEVDDDDDDDDNFGCFNHFDNASSDSSEDEDEDNLIIQEEKEYTHSSSNLPKGPFIPLKIEPINLSEIGSLTNLVQLLTIEEFDLVTDCKDPQLKELLVLNRVKQVQIKALMKMYNAKLTQCERELEILKTKEVQSTKDVNVFYKCGFPYFSYMQSRPQNNQDYFTKKANNIVNFNYSKKKIIWTRHIRNKLKICVIYNYYANLHKGNGNGSEGEDITISLDKLKKNLNAVKVPDLWNDEYINWDHIAENNFLNWAPPDCLRAMWNLYVHPSINKSRFTATEVDQINDYVKGCDTPNWNECALLLTNRSEYQVCARYQMSRTEGIYTYKDALERAHARRKGYYYKNRQKCTMGQFTAEENFTLICLLKKYGEDFRRISEHMPSRNMPQIVNRYRQNMQKDRRLASYSREENETILEHVKQHGAKNWNLLAKNLPRNAAQLRHRYRRLRKWLAENPDESVRSAPSRAVSVATMRMQKQLSKYSKLVNKSDLDALPLCPRRTGRLLSSVDERLVQFFMSTARLKTARKVVIIDPARLNACYATVKNVLNIFQATLHIPEDLTTVLFYSDIDEIDEKVLTKLRDSEYADARMSDIVMPPNLCSAQALRFLLLQSFTYNTDPALSLPKTALTPGQLQFKERFKSFLKVPSLMSIVQPPTQSLAVKSIKQEADEAQKRSVGRPRKNLSKISLMNAARKTVNLIEPAESGQMSDSRRDSTHANHPISLSFVFQDGALIPNDKPAEEPGTQVVVPKVLQKVDKSIIERLKKQNLIKVLKPIVLHNVQIMNRDAEAGTSSNNSPAPRTYSRKRSPRVDNENAMSNEKKIKFEHFVLD